MLSPARQASATGSAIAIFSCRKPGSSALEKGFYETEISRATEIFGNIAHAFSTYESRRRPQEAPFARGINSIQLLHDGERWWVTAMVWDAERADNTIPARYLPRLPAKEPGS